MVQRCSQVVTHAHEKVSFSTPEVGHLASHVVEGVTYLRQLIVTGFRGSRREVARGVEAGDFRQSFQPPAEVAAEADGEHDGESTADDQRE